MSRLPPAPPLGKPTPKQLGKIRQLHEDYKRMPPRRQMAFDADLWYYAILAPGRVEKREILKRVFTVLRWGGLYFRPDKTRNDWKRWPDIGWPIATALSHGCRVMIQLPQLDPRVKGQKFDHEFFQWLTNAHAGTGICPERQGTHATGNRPDDWVKWKLPDGRIKVLEELKGGKHGVAQFFGTSSGKSYGINLALGGSGWKTVATEQRIADNGCHGHLYIYYRPPAKDKYGGLLIGCEGEAPGCYGASGNFHSWDIKKVDEYRGHKPSQHEGQFGPKWADKHGNTTFQLPDPQSQELIGGPDRYDSLIVDLTATGWKFLRALADDFNPEMVRQPAAPPRPIANVPTDRRLLAQIEEYGRIGDSALQLRLACLIKNAGKQDTETGAALRNSKNFQMEYKALVKAIYGDEHL